MEEGNGHLEPSGSGLSILTQSEMKPKILSTDHFGTVTVDPGIRSSDRVKEVYVSMSNGTSIRLEQGIQYTVNESGNISFRFQPEDIGELFKSSVTGITIEHWTDVEQAANKEPAKKKTVSYESPWKLKRRS